MITFKYKNSWQQEEQKMCTSVHPNPEPGTRSWCIARGKLAYRRCTRGGDIPSIAPPIGAGRRAGSHCADTEGL